MENTKTTDDDLLEKEDTLNPTDTDEEAVCSTEEAGEETADEVTQSDEAAEEFEEEKAEDKKGLFGKKKEKKDKKTEQIEELTDRLKRSMAEFDNFRKRTEKERAQMYDFGAKEVVEKMLPVLDNFERAFAGVDDEQKKDPFVDGMDKVYKQFLTAFEDLGVKPIDTLGQPFDPNLHNAVMHVDDENLGENVVAEEFQKGYLYKETVVRHSMVKVAN